MMLCPWRVLFLSVVLSGWCSGAVGLWSWLVSGVKGSLDLNGSYQAVGLWCFWSLVILVSGVKGSLELSFVGCGALCFGGDCFVLGGCLALTQCKV